MNAIRVIFLTFNFRETWKNAERIKQETSSAFWNTPSYWRHWLILRGIAGIKKYLQFMQQRRQSPMASCCSECTGTHASVQHTPVFPLIHKTKQRKNKPVATATRISSVAEISSLVSRKCREINITRMELRTR